MEPTTPEIKRVPRTMIPLRSNRDKPRRKFNKNLAEKNAVIDYKDVQLLKNFMTERGKILPRRLTGASAKEQRKIATAIKRARIIALMPFGADNS